MPIQSARRDGSYCGATFSRVAGGGMLESTENRAAFSESTDDQCREFEGVKGADCDEDVEAVLVESKSAGSRPSAPGLRMPRASPRISSPKSS